MSELAVVVLVSGNGSNLQLLIDEAAAGSLPISIRAVISDRAGAYAMERAARAGIPTRLVDYDGFHDRREFCRALEACIDGYAPGLVVLAGFMRVLPPDCVAHYSGRMINLHPSLLPKYPGLDTHRRVLAHGDAAHGASVHFVTNELDAGPLIIQGRVAVEPTDTADTLQRKVQAVEHEILPTAVRWIAEGRLSVRDGRVLLDGRIASEQGLTAAAPRRDPTPASP